MKVGDLVKFVDIFGNDQRIALILAVDVDLAETTFGWVNKAQLEVINASR
tara:strand:+ start:43 stop:192 length:150 start_codon:yes stop_codon:yes gene_type:complete